MKQKEYGGFLPLELNTGKEWFSKWEDHLSRYNSVKAALDDLIRNALFSCVYVPYYYCPSTIEAIRRTGVRVKLYHINDDFLPANLPDEKDTAVLLVNYFGLMGKDIEQYAKKFRKATVILDNAHAFFSNPLSPSRYFTVYSAKKFFGVPDGAYLTGPISNDGRFPPTLAADYSGFLLTAYEKGTNAAYEEKKRVDGLLASTYGGMSELAQGLLKNVDYERVRTRRTENYSQLRGAFAYINELDLPEKSAAYLFPLYLKDRGEKMKKVLISSRIYVPTLWNGADLMEKGTNFETSLAKNTLFLPVDQRYDEEDMSVLIEKVKEILS
jgi:hypothetical protein